MSEHATARGLANNCFALADLSGLNRTGLPDFLPIEAAWQLLSERIAPVAGIERLPVAQALGRVLAADVLAQRDLPPVANAAVDGYGFDGRVAVSAPRAVVASLRAGDPVPPPLPENGVARVLTGALLPPNVDRVAMEEDCQVLADGRVLLPSLKPNSNRRPAGEILKAGTVALPAGQRLRAQELALALASGQQVLAVRRTLRVALFSSGEELVASAPSAAQIIDVNGPMLAALLTRPAVAVTFGGILPDDDARVETALHQAAADHDLIVTSGGASMSEADCLRRVLARAGRADIWRLAIKPGRPLVMGQLAGCPVVGLPGNPVAAYVTARLIAEPLCRALAGDSRIAPRFSLVRAGFTRRSKSGRAEFLRVRLGEGTADAASLGAVELFARDGAGIIPSLTFADGLVWIAADCPEVQPGDLLPFLPI